MSKDDLQSLHVAMIEEVAWVLNLRALG